jgi:hypothetical protein
LNKIQLDDEGTPQSGLFIDKKPRMSRLFKSVVSEHVACAYYPGMPGGV